MWRQVSPEDHARVVELYLALNAEDPGARPADPEHTRRTLAAFAARPERGRCLVLEEDGRVEGYALLAACWSNELGGDVLAVDELYVCPGSRGRGRARELLALVERGAFGWQDAVALQLEVSPANRRARALYERAGFRAIQNETLRRLLGR